MCQMNKWWICGEVGDAALPDEARSRVGGQWAGCRFKAIQMRSTHWSSARSKKLDVMLKPKRSADDDDEAEELET